MYKYFKQKVCLMRNFFFNLVWKFRDQQIFYLKNNYTIA